MTNKEAVELLDSFRICVAPTLSKAMSVAISALTAQESCNQPATNLQPSNQDADDTISRQAAIDAVKKNTFRLTLAEEQNCEGHVAWSAEAVYSDVMEGALLELPSAQPETHEKRTETHACDCISRQAAKRMTGKKDGLTGVDGIEV